MATLDWPITSGGFKPARMRFGASTPKSAWGGFFTGQSQSISHLADRLRVELTLPPCSHADAGVRESFVMQLASSGDWVRLGHFLRPLPLGDMRGATIVYENAAAGARTLRIGQATTLTNLLTGTQAFNSTDDWTVSNVVVTANTHARPNASTISADTVSDASAGASGYLQQVVGVASGTGTYTGSVNVRKTSGGTSATFALEMELMTGGTPVTSNIRINTDTGAILSAGGGDSDLTTDGLYWRISNAITDNGTGNTELEFRLYPARAPYGVNTAAASATGTAVIWGAQLELGATRSTYDGTPALQGGDIVGVGSQLLVTGYVGETQATQPYLEVPLALPLRQAVTAGTAVTWDRPTGNFQLLGDLSQVEYLPGRYQDAMTLQFVEAY